MGKRIPIGVEFYKQMIDKDYYYIDKTLLIRDILDIGASVSLFTRPRRFGKTLALNMLQTFFKDERDVVLIFELKKADKFARMDVGCEAALAQIEEKHYEAEYREEGYERFVKYGICFYKKSCRVKGGIEEKCLD